MSEGGREVLQVLAQGKVSTGSWRTTVLLDQGRYEFSGKARTEGVASVAGETNGVILRISGERSTKGISIVPAWTTLIYEFEVHGISSVELAAEFRGNAGTGSFDSASFKLVRKKE